MDGKCLINLEIDDALDYDVEYVIRILHVDDGGQFDAGGFILRMRDGETRVRILAADHRL
jgi:hypothetical protein